MANLSTKIKLYANQEVDFINDVKLQDDGQGAYIKEWNLDIAKPSESTLNALDGQSARRMNILRKQRDNLLKAIASIIGRVQISVPAK